MNKHALPTSITKSEEVQFPIHVCLCFIVDLLMHHKLCCVNLIDRSWKTCKETKLTNTHTYLNPSSLGHEKGSVCTDEQGEPTASYLQDEPVEFEKEPVEVQQFHWENYRSF